MSVRLTVAALGVDPVWLGVLISPTVFLSAGHGTAHFDAAGVTRARVTFDPTVTASSTWYEGTVHTNPAYDPSAAGLGNRDIGDLGVIVFDEPVPGVTPASLPTERILDQLASGPRSARFEIAGYGVSQYTGAWNRGGRRTLDFSSGGTRRLALEAFASLSPAWLRLRSVGSADLQWRLRFSEHLVRHQCRRWHHGAPNDLDGFQCESGPWEERVDTPASREFLSHYVHLP